MKINILFNLCLTINSENFHTFKSRKFNHIGHMFLNLNEEQIIKYINTLENKREKFINDLEKFNDNNNLILINEAKNWKNYLIIIKSNYEDYKNKNISEREFLYRSINILINSLNNLKSYENYQHIDIIEKGILFLKNIKKDNNLSIKNVIYIINNIGELLTTIDVSINNISYLLTKFNINLSNLLNFSSHQ